MTPPQWWERLVAAIIDGLVLAVPTFLIYFVFIIASGRSWIAYVLLNLFATLIVTAGIVAYRVFLEASPRQATLGKMVFGLKVVNESGQAPSKVQAFVRSSPWWLMLLTVFQPVPILGLIISILVLLAFIGVFVSCVLSPDGAGIHDRFARARVIKAGPGMLAQPGQS
jgi:uncharacterized RDD family membrane protein YckC